MFFKTLLRRPRKPSNSKSTKPSLDRISTLSASDKNPDIKVSSTAIADTEADLTEEGARVADEEDRDYQEFLVKAKRDAELKEKEMLRTIIKARETNLSPWAGRM